VTDPGPIGTSLRPPVPVPSIDPQEAGWPPAPAGPPAPASHSSRWVLEWVVVLVAALLLAVGIRTSVAQMFYIPSGSMLPTLKIGDRIIVDKLSYHVHGVHRGDIVVFRRPPLEKADYTDLVKRVIGLPGDVISLHLGRVDIDGRPLAEPWLPTPAPVSSPSPLTEPFSLNHPYRVPPDEYFVMGDNRTDSEDSRYFGPIPASLIVGKMAFVIWPLGATARLVVVSVLAVVMAVAVVAVVVGLALSGRRHGRLHHRHRVGVGGRDGAGVGVGGRDGEGVGGTG